MADKKISALDAIVSVDDADVLPIVDTSVTTTKKINVSQIKALAPVQSVASKTGAVTLVKGDVGLGNVDNTADADKPVSSATQTALNAKQDTLVNQSNLKSINGTSLLGSGNIEIAGGSSNWGEIGGTLSNQTDLQSALDGKVDENAAITGATKTKITYDAKGLVTSGADATTADIADSTDKRYVTDSQLTVIGNTSGTNSGDNAVNSLYSGLAASKQDVITGAATTITSSDLTASRALVSDGSGKVAVSDVTSTELGYLDGVTSAVQTQLDAKIAKFDGTTYDVNALAAVSQAEYDALTPSATTLYFII
jgi:hypothetical protein